MEINRLQKIKNTKAQLVLKFRKCKSIKTGIVNLHWIFFNRRISFQILITILKCLHDICSTEKKILKINLIHHNNKKLKIIIFSLLARKNITIKASTKNKKKTIAVIFLQCKS